ncbi:lipase family protein [Gordonia polyisoprenivorans]|uniref:lipase family protein n=1 Tax=Gordonia polyisoprenivorans TaxID=84595 RepID=UPI0002DDE843|nr:lipase family protein [Gordonia polyisoprenivorans]
MRSRAGVARSGSRGRAGVIVGLVVLVLVAWVQLPGAAAADEPPTYSGAVPLTPPGLGTIFGGYVLGTFRDGRLATGQEDFEGLAADDPFYVEPSISQDVKPGTLLKAKRFDVLFAGVKPAHVAAYKIMYVTENVRGRKVISTGVVMIPEDGKPNGSRSVVAYQEANDSVGAKCHPSTQWSGGALGEASAWSALGPLALMFQRGLAVVISDIGNDADPSPHGVFAGKFAGHALLDGVRAAYRVGPAALNPRNPVGIFGVAGGGVGAGFAAENVARYAPEINLKATMLEGMAVDQKNFIRFADGRLGTGFVFATLLGLEAQYPEMALDKKLNPAGRALADAYRKSCQMAYFGMPPLVPLKTLFTSGQAPADIPEFAHVYRDNTLGRGDRPRGKVLVSACNADNSFMSLIPAADSKNLVTRYARQGADAQYYGMNCGMDVFVTNIYKWGTELFGMHTVDWLATEVNS